MTTSSLNKKKEQYQDSYIDFSNDQIRALDNAKTEEEFDKLMFDYVEQHNYNWYREEGLDHGEAMARAKSVRKNAGG